MKRILIATALIAATAGGAFAQSAGVTLSAPIQAQILTWIPGADLSNLTSAQYGQIVSLFSNSDNLSGGINGKATVEAILGVQ